MTEGTEAPAEGTTAQETEKPAEQTVPYERFQQANTKAKEAAARATALEKSVAELKAAMEERENAGLPELERMRKDMERLSKRAEDAEAKAAEADQKLARSAKERWVIAAAKDFNDPSDAAAFISLDEIEDEKDAERAVKKLAQAKKHLLKAEDPKLPGQVLRNGQAAVPATAATATADKRVEEAEMLVSGLKQFLQNQ
jgi:hypothetical protein